MQGRLVVTSASGDELGQIKPGMPTGEMGVFTDQPRSANISAAERSIAVVIGRDALLSVLASNQTIHWAQHGMDSCREDYKLLLLYTLKID